MNKKKYRVLYEIKSLEKIIVRAFMQDTFFEIKEIKNFPTPTQFQIIEYILDANGAVYQKDLENVLNLRRATVSGVLQTMEKNHLIERVPSENDARVKQIFLNEKTKQLFLKQKKKMEQMEQVVVNEISKKDLELFVHVLNVMKQNVNQYTTKTASCKKRRSMDV